VMDAVKTAAMLATDRVHVLRQAIWACRKGGTISMPGVYVGAGDMIPLGAFMNKGLTLKTGQTHMQKYMPKLLERIETGTSIRHSSLRTRYRSSTRLKCIRRSSTKWTGASRLC